MEWLYETIVDLELDFSKRINPFQFSSFDVCMLLYVQRVKKIDNLEFRKNLVTDMRPKYGKMPRATGPKSSCVSFACLNYGQHLTFGE